jgi:hypothetical protein
MEQWSGVTYSATAVFASTRSVITLEGCDEQVSWLSFVCPLILLPKTIAAEGIVGSVLAVYYFSKNIFRW